MVCYEQVSLNVWNSLLLRPLPLLIKDIKVKVSKQNLNKVHTAQIENNSGKISIAPMSCQPYSKPNVGRR